MNRHFTAMSINELDKDLKRILRVQFKEFIHHLDEGIMPRNPAAGRRISLAAGISRSNCDRLVA